MTIDNIYGPSRIYFIAINEFVKIGYTQSVKQRMDNFNTCSPYAAKLLYAFPGDRTIEQFLHHKFDQHHHRGEWFRLHQDILNFIADHKNDPDTSFFKGERLPGVRAA